MSVIKVDYGEVAGGALDAQVVWLTAGTQNQEKTYTIDPTKFYVLTGVQRYNDSENRCRVYDIAYGALNVLDAGDSVNWVVTLSGNVLSCTAKGTERVSWALVEVG